MASLPTSPPSALARPLDPSFASNRLAVLGAAAGLVLPLLLRRSWRQAVGISGAALLGWATGRELDPDHPETAALALGLAGGASLLGGSGQMQALLPGLSALSSLRLLVGTVGLPAGLPDAAALSAQGGLAAVTGQRSAGLLPAAALWLSWRQRDDLSSQATGGWWSAVALGAGSLPRWRGTAAKRSVQLPGRTPLSDVLGLAALGLASLGLASLGLTALGLGTVLTAPERPLSARDHGPQRVSGERLQRARVLTLGALALGLLRGESGGLLPLSAAALATSLRRLSKR